MLLASARETTIPHSVDVDLKFGGWNHPKRCHAGFLTWLPQL